MNKAWLLLAISMLASQHSQAACALRVAHQNVASPPYYLGVGSDTPNPPGAAVELLHEIIASNGCTVAANIRLPLPRIFTMLAEGSIDAAAMGLPKGADSQLVYPRDKQGKPDPERALRVYFMVFVRASDQVPKEIDPMKFLVGKKVGLSHGSSLGPILREAGVMVDDGAADLSRNLDKLIRHRIDAYAISALSPDGLDAAVATQHGGAIVRLDKPLRTSHVWLVTSQAFYKAHHDKVEAMWTWVGANASKRFGELLKKYD